MKGSVLCQKYHQASVRLDGAQVAWMEDSSPSCTHFLRETSPLKQGFATKDSFVVPQRTLLTGDIWGCYKLEKGGFLAGRVQRSLVTVPAFSGSAGGQELGIGGGMGIQEAWEERKWGQWVGTTEFCQVFLEEEVCLREGFASATGKK